MMIHYLSRCLAVTSAAAILCSPTVVLAEETRPIGEDNGPQEDVLDSDVMGLSFQTFGGRTIAPREATFLPAIGMTYFIEPSNALRIEFALASTLRPDFDFGVQFGGGYRLYFLGQIDQVAPFIEPGALMVFTWDDRALTLGAYADLGAEYFFSEQLSVSGSVGFQGWLVDFADDILLGTSRSALHLNFYW